MQISKLREDDLYIKMWKIGFGRSDYRRVLIRFDKMLKEREIYWRTKRILPYMLYLILQLFFIRRKENDE